jgi:hypothetical protein
MKQSVYHITFHSCSFFSEAFSDAVDNKRDMRSDNAKCSARVVMSVPHTLLHKPYCGQNYKEQKTFILANICKKLLKIFWYKAHKI